MDALYEASGQRIIVVTTYIFDFTFLRTKFQKLITSQFDEIL